MVRDESTPLHNPLISTLFPTHPFFQLRLLYPFTCHPLSPLSHPSSHLFYYLLSCSMGHAHAFARKRMSIAYSGPNGDTGACRWLPHPLEPLSSLQILCLLEPLSSLLSLALPSGAAELTTANRKKLTIAHSGLDGDTGAYFLPVLYSLLPFWFLSHCLSHDPSL